VVIIILYRTLFVLGVISFIAVLIFAENGPTQPFVPVIPSFQNPFNNVGGFSANAPLEQQTNYWEYPTYSNVTTSLCNNITYYECVEDNPDDQDYTYVALRNFDNPLNDGSNLAYIDFGLVGTGFDWTRVSAMNVIVWCRWDVVAPNNNKTITVSLIEAQGANVFFLIDADDTGDCTESSTFGRLDFIDNTILGAPNGANADVHIRIAMEGSPGGSISVEITAIIVTVFFSSDTTCAGSGFFGDVSCQIGNIFRPVVQFLGLVMGILLFVAEFFITIGQLITNYIAVIVWLYAIPGMPTVIQAFVDVWLTVLLVTVIIEFFKLIKPFGG